ncbi:MAG: VanZ family protein [archaeon]
MDKKIIFSVLSGIYVLLLLVGSFIVKPNSVFPDGGFDYYAHIIGFFVFAVMFFFTLKFYSVKSKLLTIAIASSALSVIVELLRIPGRGFSIVDLAFDILGSLIGLVVAWSFSKR